MAQASGSPVQYDQVSGNYLNLLSLWYLPNPPTGSNTVSVTFANEGGATFTDCLAAAISLGGAGTVGTAATASDTTGSSSVASVAVPGTTNSDYVVGAAMSGTTFSGAAGATTQSAVINASGNSAGDNLILGYQQTTGGTATATFDVASADFWGGAAVEVFPVAAVLMGQICL